MGADQSVNTVKDPSPTPPTSNKCVRSFQGIQSHKAWQEAYTCSISSWAKRYSTLFGFEHKVDYYIPPTRRSLLIQNIQPYCTRGYQFKVEQLYTAARLSNDCSKADQGNHSDTQPFPNAAPSVCVIGYQRTVAVLQVVYKKTKELHFIAIELRTGKQLSVHRDIYVSEPCIYEAYISPDESCYLLRPNFLFAFSRCIDPFLAFSITKDIRVIGIGLTSSNNPVHVLKIVEDVSDMWHSITFDPSHGHSRIALGNVPSDVIDDAYNIEIYDMERMKTIVSSKHSELSVSHHLVYNPQGSLLVSIGVHMSLPHPRIDCLQPIKLLIHSAVDLSLLQVICRDSPSIHYFYISLSPIFAKTGEYMAVIGNFGRCMTVYQMPRDLKLKHMCRTVILKHVTEKDICALPLPKSLVDFLQFLPSWD